MRNKSSKNHFDFKDFPTTTVSQSRLPIFLPVKRVASQKESVNIEISNSWGKCTIRKCRLTQVHRNIIETIFNKHKQLYIDDNGEVSFLFNPYDIQKFLGKAPDNRWFSQKLDELRETTIVVQSDKWKVHTGIILRHQYLTNDDYRDSNSTKFGQENPYMVTFSSEFMKLFSFDLNVYYNKLLGELVLIKSSVTQAVIRFCLTHRSINIELVNLLSTIYAVRPDMSKRAIRYVFSEIQDNIETLKNFGITIRDGVVYYKQHDHVYFKNPDKETANAA